jgi:hypothetical protein
MKRTVTAVFLLLLSALPASAQFDTAQISGVIQDTTKAVLPGVDVTLINVGTGLERHAVTNQDGLYTFTNVPVGDYRIVATLSGFKTVTRPDVRVNAGVNIRVDFALEVGQVAESITVTGTATVTDTAVLARTVSAEQLAATPLSGRRATQVAQLTAGVVGGNMGGGVPTATGTFATGVTSINGGRSDEFTITVDGAPSIRIRQAGGFTMGAQNIDTVAEVQVLTTNYQAEFGRASSGQLRLVTKSGTQSFRGNVFWNNQNDALEANTWTRNRSGLAKTPRDWNAYGFTLGGPLYLGKLNSSKQKLFFFWGEEWTRDRAEQNRTAIVPTQAMRNGDFSELLNPANPFFNRVRTITDPRTGQPFPNNVIPRDRISPNGQALMNAYPLPTPGFQQGSSNWIGTSPFFNNQRKDSIKIDWVPSSNHRFAVRHTWAPNVWNDVATVKTFSTIWDYPGRTLAATMTNALSPSLIHEFTFSWGSTAPARFFGQRNCSYCPSDYAVDYPTKSQLGMNYPLLFPGTKLDPEKLPNIINLQGFTASDNLAYPGAWNDFVFLWADNITKITGNHTFKAGVSIERSGMNDQIQLSFAQAPATTNQNGSFRFTDLRPGATGLSAANAILGLFDDYTEFGNKPNTRWLAMAYDMFVQDSWKPTRDITLELGLRFSLWQQWQERNNSLASFNPQYYDAAQAAVIDRAGGFVVSGDRFNGIVLPGTAPTPEALAQFPQLANLQRLYHGIPEGFAPTPKDGLQPRLGLAYAINDKTTFRTGAGLFLNRVQINTTAAYGFNPPLSEMQTVINGNVDAPGGAQTRAFPLLMAMQDPNFTNPRSWAWNATVDRELGGGMRAQASYVGRSATHLERARNINELPPGTIQANPGVNANALRPYKGFGTITKYETTGQSTYNALQVQVERRSARNVGFSAAYTFSRTKDDGSGRNDILLKAFDDGSYYGISDLDRPHVFVTQVRYPLPDLDQRPAPLRWIFGHWDASGVFQAQSGAPFSVRTANDIAGIGPGGGNQFYNVVGDPMNGRTEFDGTRAIWFDRNAFQAPAPGTFATTQARNTLRQPGFWDFNLSLRKSVPVGTHRFEFRMDAFNVLNRTNLGGASTNPNVGDFGTITSLVGNRVVQLGLQYVF